jgi:acyl-CoA reductase-like NAD-dependent aldehyde dehydrogenase
LDVTVEAVVSINGGMYHGPDAPFGGYKQSGIGREMGVAGQEGTSTTRPRAARRAAD